MIHASISDIGRIKLYNPPPLSFYPNTPVIPHSTQLSELAIVLKSLLSFTHPADAVISHHFRGHPDLGRRDRALIAETAYSILRHLRSLETAVESQRPRDLIIAWLARLSGLNLRECEGLVHTNELDRYKAAKAFDLAAAPTAIRLDLPNWLEAPLTTQYGDRLPALMRALNNNAPLDLRVNSLKMSRAHALEQMLADGFAATATPWSPLGIRLANKPPLNQYPLFQDGALEVQDEGSQILALLTGARRGEMVCDFCAGAGGKTLALGAQMNNSGRLYAFDTSEKRLARMKPRLARSGLSNVHPQVLASETDSKVKRLAGKFDRVLVDAPCSGLGTLRRNPDLKWRQNEVGITELTAKQALILNSAARLPKVGGTLVYATCSLLEVENQAIVETFLATHPHFTLQPVADTLTRLNITLETGPYLALAPDQHGTDGFFAAILQRTA